MVLFELLSNTLFPTYTSLEIPEIDSKLKVHLYVWFDIYPGYGAPYWPNVACTTRVRGSKTRYFKK
jgi:hypothetical protein